MRTSTRAALERIALDATRLRTGKRQVLTARPSTTQRRDTRSPASTNSFYARAATRSAQMANHAMRGCRLPVVLTAIEIHKGEFKQGCDSCHTTTTWKKSSFTTT